MCDVTRAKVSAEGTDFAHRVVLDTSVKNDAKELQLQLSPSKSPADVTAEKGFMKTIRITLHFLHLPKKTTLLVI